MIKKSIESDSKRGFENENWNFQNMTFLFQNFMLSIFFKAAYQEAYDLSTCI